MCHVTTAWHHMNIQLYHVVVCLYLCPWSLCCAHLEMSHVSYMYTVCMDSCWCSHIWILITSCLSEINYENVNNPLLWLVLLLGKWLLHHAWCSCWWDMLEEGRHCYTAGLPWNWFRMPYSHALALSRNAREVHCTVHNAICSPLAMYLWCTVLDCRTNSVQIVASHACQLHSFTLCVICARAWNRRTVCQTVSDITSACWRGNVSHHDGLNLRQLGDADDTNTC